MHDLVSFPDRAYACSGAVESGNETTHDHCPLQSMYVHNAYDVIWLPMASRALKLASHFLWLSTYLWTNQVGETGGIVTDLVGGLTRVVATPQLRHSSTSLLVSDGTTWHIGSLRNRGFSRRNWACVPLQFTSLDLEPFELSTVCCCSSDTSAILIYVAMTTWDCGGCWAIDQTLYGW